MINKAIVDQTIASAEVQAIKLKAVEELKRTLDADKDLIPLAYTHDEQGFIYRLASMDAAINFAEQIKLENGVVTNLQVMDQLVTGVCQNKAPDVLSDGEFNLVMAYVFNYAFNEVLGFASEPRNPL